MQFTAQDQSLALLFRWMGQKINDGSYKIPITVIICAQNIPLKYLVPIVVGLLSNKKKKRERVQKCYMT